MVEVMPTIDDGKDPKNPKKKKSITEKTPLVICDDSELGEKLIDLCLVILGKAVKLTKTDMDDKLLETVKAALATRD